MQTIIIKTAATIRLAIEKAVLLAEDHKLDKSMYKDEIFVLSEYLGNEFKCSYKSILHHWNKEMTYPPKQHYGLFRDERAIHWQAQGLNEAEIADKLEYCDYKELCKQFRRRQGKELSEFKNQVPVTFLCLRKCENHPICGERQTFLGEKQS